MDEMHLAMFVNRKAQKVYLWKLINQMEKSGQQLSVACNDNDKKRGLKIMNNLTDTLQKMKEEIAAIRPDYLTASLTALVYVYICHSLKFPEKVKDYINNANVLSIDELMKKCVNTKEKGIDDKMYAQIAAEWEFLGEKYKLKDIKVTKD